MPIRLDRPAPHIARLTLSNAGRRNALTADMWAAIPDALAGVEARVLLVEGEGDHFASGADITEFETLYATPEGAARISASISHAFDAVAAFPAPTLAVVRGACVGGGAGIALACDMRFADSTAKFAVTPARLGLVYPFDDMRRLVGTVGLARARDILFSARVIGAVEAQGLHLYTRVTAPEELENEVMDYADGLTRLSPASLAAMKIMLAKIEAGQSEDDAATRQMFQGGFASSDFEEGFRAFLDKRRPEFGGN